MNKYINCKNCNTPITEKYCPNCGQAVQLKRIDKHYISHEFLHLLHFEKGFFYTIRELITRPGDSINEFIHDNRSKHMKPLAFVILTSLLFTIIAHFFHADNIYNSKAKVELANSYISTIFEWTESHYGYANLISGFFYALCVKLFFRKKQYNIFEITVLLCFVIGQSMLLLSIATFFKPILQDGGYKIVLGIISFAYPTWAIGQFFDKRNIWSYAKAFLAFCVAYVFFVIAIIAIGLSLDTIMKMH
jgi:Protein of unknown function (DUF3667)